MSDAARAPSGANRVPVSIVTGFLGSGKTTLLNRLVRHEGMADTALIVNEFGEIGIDHELVDSAFENTVLMESGCICCSIRGDLIDTINDLFANAANGRIPRFSRILVETTGLADPVPVGTTVDGQQGAAQIEAHAEVARQIGAADVIVLTKTDIASADAVRRIRHRIDAINPGVPVRVAVRGELDPDELFRHCGREARADAEALLAAPLAHGRVHDHPRGDTHDHDHAHDHREEPGRVASHSIALTTPLAWDRLRTFLETVFSLRGQAFLRVKGILDIEGIARPVVLQGVGNGFSAPTMLPEWPKGGRRSRLVFIYQDLDAGALDSTFAHMVLNGHAERPHQDNGANT
jgi:G3E family GTPase